VRQNWKEPDAGVPTDLHNSEFLDDTISGYISDLSPSSWAQYIVSSFLALAVLYMAISTVPQPTQPTLAEAVSILVSDFVRLFVVLGVLVLMGASIIYTSSLLNCKRRALTAVRTAVFFERDQFDSVEEKQVRDLLKVLDDIMESLSARRGTYRKLVEKAQGLVKPPQTPSPQESEHKEQPSPEKTT